MNTQNEPLVTTGVITALVAAAVTLAVAFGLPLTSEQQIAIGGFTAVVAPLVVALVARRKVTPSANVAVVVNKQDQLVAGEALDVPNGQQVDVYGSDEEPPHERIDYKGW